MSDEHATPSSDHEQFEDAQDDSTQQQPLAQRTSQSSLNSRSLTDSPSRKQSEADAVASPILEEEATPRVSQAESQKELDTPHGGSQQESLKSPPMTARRHAKNPSTTSFAEVHLDENPSPTSQAHPQHPESIPEATTPHVGADRGRAESTTASITQPSERSESRQSRQSSVSSRPGSNRSSVPTSTNMPPPAKPFPQPSRTFSSPFGWFQRKKTASTTSIPQVTARNSVTAQPELKLEGLGEEPTKESLKERFKQLRMKEEAGIEINKVSSPDAMTPGGVGLGIDTAVNGAGADDDASTKSPAPSTDRDSVVSYSAAPRRPSSASTINTDLPPGTVVGAQTGPAPIDWDLWQNVVNEGPTAVAKSTPAELNKAIASGIPSTIRGVVWQVFAQSEDKGLEMKYWELVHRGTDKDHARSPNRSPAVTPGISPVAEHNGSVATTESADSASVHSESSTPATTNGVSSPTLDVPNLDPKAQAELAKKAKDELAALKKLEKTIRKDLGSRSNYSRYASSGDLQEGLFNVCKAYALYDPEVGYAQGMNFIVMPLLFNMPQEEAFCLLVRLMHHYRVRDMFIPEMPGLHLHIEQFSRLLEDNEPALAHHLHKRSITPQLYATQWFLTLFAYRFPLQLVLRIYDLVLSEGFESAILKFALALMQKNSTSLMAIKDMTGLKTFLSEKLFDIYIDKSPHAGSISENGFFGFIGNGSVDREVYRADLLVEDACAVIINPKELESMTREYKTKVQEEKDRDEELSRLRREHTQFSSRIKELEKHAQKTDADHVKLTNQMLASKMENEELRTQVADLELECNELKISVASLPAEIERGLQDEMEANKKRCEDMQAQVAKSEEEKQEYEGQVIDIKMQWATLNGEHEQLKQKWTDLRRALGD